MTKIKSLLLKHEGLCLKPYKDSVGKLTIGVGRNIDDLGISTDEAMLLLDNDIARCENEANTFKWYASLSDNRKAVILSMLFNLGLHRFCGFKKMIAALEAGDYCKAADEMTDSKWARDVGDRDAELVRMMRAG